MLTLTPGRLMLAQLRGLAASHTPIELAAECEAPVRAAAATVQTVVTAGVPVYGINTGFGKLAHVQIADDQLEQLQTNLVRSHAAGVGRLLEDATVRLILVLKIVSLARGYSGVRWEVVQTLVALHNAQIYACIPAQGSVGASGDLAPLAHLTLAAMGEGDVRVNGVRMPAADALAQAGITPIRLAAKEGLALLNGTQVSTGIALMALFAAEQAFSAAVVAGSLSIDAAAGSDTPFDPRIHIVRGQPGQIRVAGFYRQLLAGSAIRESHRQNDTRVQDPYSLRCQPQVMGACLDLLSQAATTLRIEANAVSDNPLVFPDDGEVLSGGNFHAEPVAFAADQIAIAIAEVGALAERRIALLVDATLSGLPAFLVDDPGINSGFMIAHVTLFPYTTLFRSSPTSLPRLWPARTRHSRIRPASTRFPPRPIRRITSAWPRSPRARPSTWRPMSGASWRSSCWPPAKASTSDARCNPLNRSKPSMLSCAA